jgi:hypothetical protein
LKLVKHLTEDNIKDIKKDINSLRRKLLKSAYEKLIPENLTHEEFDIYSD